MRLAEYLEHSVELFRAVAASSAPDQMEAAARLTAQALKAAKPLLVCGGGGASAEIAGALVGRVLRDRRGLRCVNLTADGAVMTALADDFGQDAVFARQVEAYGEAGGVLFATSPAGNDGALVPAFEKARALGMTTIALTGEDGGRLTALADILIAVPSRHKPDVQQLQSCLCHYFSERVENLCL